MQKECYMIKNKNTGKYVCNIVKNKDGKISHLEWLTPSLIITGVAPFTFKTKKRANQEIDYYFENFNQEPKYSKEDLTVVKLVISEERTEEQVRKDISDSKL